MSASDTIEDKERIFSSTFTSKATLPAKVRYWASAEKSDDFVKKALGLNGLKGKDLTNHPNYKYYRTFLWKAEGHKMDQWIWRDGTTRKAVWKKYGLDKMPADELLKSDGFKSYVHLMAKYDDILWADRHENGLNSLWVHYQDDPDAQVYAAVLVWAKAKRPRSYVEKALGIYGVPYYERSGTRNSKLFNDFLRLTGRKK